MKRTLLSLVAALGLMTTGWAQTAQIDKVSPMEVEQGETLELTVSGLNTSFVSDFGALSSLTNAIRISPMGYYSQGQSIQIHHGHVEDDEHLKVYVSVPNNAPVGAYGIRTQVAKEQTEQECYYYWTGSEYDQHCVAYTTTRWETKYSLYPALEVKAASGNPHLTGVSPKEVTQGETLELIISGANTNFNDLKSYTSISRALDISTLAGEVPVHHTSVIDDNTLKAYVTIPENAPVGPGVVETNRPYFTSSYGYTYWENDLTLFPAFQIKAKESNPHISEVSPNKVEPGETLTLTVSGINTSFNDLKAYSSLTQNVGVFSLFESYSSSDNIQINDIQIVNDGEIKLDITVPETATVESYGVYIMEDGSYSEVIALYPAFEVGDLAWLEGKTDSSTTTVGVEDEVSMQEFIAYPTVTEGNLQLEFELPNQASVQVKAFDLTGRFLGTFMSTNLEAGFYESSIDITDLKAQTVIIGVFADGKMMYNTKVIKK